MRDGSPDGQCGEVKHQPVKQVKQVPEAGTWSLFHHLKQVPG